MKDLYDVSVPFNLMPISSWFTSNFICLKFTTGRLIKDDNKTFMIPVKLIHAKTNAAENPKSYVVNNDDLENEEAFQVISTVT